MSKQIISFLTSLSENNNKEWFEAHRDQYESARNELVVTTDNIINGINTFDSTIGSIEAKKCLFRQYRDVRFSKNKLPYKSTMSAYIAPGGKNSNFAGYYIHIEPNKSFIGGGIYSPTPEILLGIRKEIYYHPETFKKVISKNSFIETFGTLMHEKLVRPPKGFPSDFPDIDLLKYKHFVVSRPTAVESMKGTDIQDIALKTFKEMLPFNQFLNQAIQNIAND